MTTLNFSEFSNKQPVSVLGNEANKTSVQNFFQPPVVKPESFGERINTVRETQGQKVRDAITGTGEYAGQSSIRRGVNATAELASSPVRMAFEALPENEIFTFRSGLKSLGKEVGSGISKIVDKVSDIPALQKWVMAHPEASKGLEELLGTSAGVGSIAGEILGAEGAVRGLKSTQDVVSAGVKPVVDTSTKIASNVIDTAKDIADRAKTTLFGSPKPVTNIDDVIRQADEATKAGPKPSQILSETEKASAKPSITEKWSGISPDIKNRIAGKQDKLKEYFDVAHARNNFDTLPTPLEYGARNVDKAVSKMDELISDTGSDIGKFRQKINTYKASIDDVNKIETSFNNQLSRLNLEVKNGMIRQKPGTVSRVNSDSEIGALNDLLGELQVIKQAPDLQRLIDLRNLFDSKINFAKSSRDISSSLDPFSRAMRSEIANVSAKIVGKSEAANLSKYSDFMDAYEQLRSFTDRKAGAEFLLKQVLSERGGTPREVMRIIKENTGIDLMDDAVMSSISTDLIGNSRQKGLFRQELTKAGLDVESLLTGNPSGAISLLLNWGKKKLINEEKQFLKAAK